MTKRPVPPQLTPFKKGQSGNPKGRAKGVRTTKAIIEDFFNQEIAFEDIKGKPKKMTMKDACILAQFKKATVGDLNALQFITERSEGKVPNETKLTGDINNPLLAVISELGSEELYEIVKTIKGVADENTKENSQKD